MSDETKGKIIYVLLFAITCLVIIAPYIIAGLLFGQEVIKIKVIDLLNKIANGEEVPKKIKSYQGQIYLYEDGGEYVCIETQDLLFDFPAFRQLGDYLNDELEVIEDKKIEKLDRDNFTGVSNLEVSGQSATQFDYVIEQEIEDIVDKINEIIDYLEENK